MADTDRERGPMTPGEKNFLAFFLAVVLGLFVADVIHDYRPTKLTGLFIILWWVPLLVLHEAGHALAAAALGWHVGRVVVGFGRVVHKTRVGQTVVALRLVALVDFIEPVPRNLRAVRLRSALVYFAGCGVQLLLLGAVALVLGVDTLVRPSDNVVVLAAQSMAVVVLLSCILNLVPYTARVGDRHIANDGLGILRSFTQPEGRFAELLGAAYDDETDEWISPGPAEGEKRG